MLNKMLFLEFLRYVLWFDALTSILLGVFQLLFAERLMIWLGLPAALLQLSGAMLLGYAALAFAIARAEPMPRGWLWVLILGNLAWAAVSLFLVLGRSLTPTELGLTYLVVHTVSPALLASLQWCGVRRLPRWTTA
ncbi:MAG: hypothetical protein EON54_06930 [Alcaligenaceae bacterium]|nr:MAG: hypothetical protein EON54_06930 [Alcaligenaceae bacterium]